MTNYYNIEPGTTIFDETTATTYEVIDRNNGGDFFCKVFELGEDDELQEQNYNQFLTEQEIRLMVNARHIIWNGTDNN